MLDSDAIFSINALSQQAGSKIMEIYEHRDFAQVVDFKSDDSPLTLADRESHRIIEKELGTLFPNIPVLSEEGKHTDYETRKGWPLFWLVDPLDGTKEFIKRNGEFTVNIALIKDNQPIAGFIYAPVPRILYYATEQGGAYRQQIGEEAVKIHAGNTSGKFTVVRSRSHADAAESEVLSQYAIDEEVAIGSSLKFCLLAEGKADLYYRHGPTMEWDTAAGQAILEIAGGAVRQLNGERLIYNKSSLLNPGFICLSKPS